MADNIPVSKKKERQYCDYCCDSIVIRLFELNNIEKEVRMRENEKERREHRREGEGERNKQGEEVSATMMARRALVAGLRVVQSNSGKIFFFCPLSLSIAVVDAQ